MEREGENEQGTLKIINDVRRASKRRSNGGMNREYGWVPINNSLNSWV